MALYDYPREKHPNITLTQFQRRPFGPTDPTVAMHWDGTYRDRCDPGTTWEGEWDNDRLASAQKIAKHLA